MLTKKRVPNNLNFSLHVKLSYWFPNPLTCHAIIRFTAGMTPRNRRIQYGTSTTRVVPKVLTPPMILFVKWMTDSALVLRFCPYTWSGLEPDVTSGVFWFTCVARAGPNAIASLMPRFIPCPPAGEWICATSPIRVTYPPRVSSLACRRNTNFSAMAACVLNRVAHNDLVIRTGLGLTVGSEDKPSGACLSRCSWRYSSEGLEGGGPRAAGTLNPIRYTASCDSVLEFSVVHFWRGIRRKKAPSCIVTMALFVGRIGWLFESVTSASTIWAIDSSTGRPSGSANPIPESWRIWEWNGDSEDMERNDQPTNSAHRWPSTVCTNNILSLDDFSWLKQHFDASQLIDVSFDPDSFIGALNFDSKDLQTFLEYILGLVLRQKEHIWVLRILGEDWNVQSEELCGSVPNI